MIKLIIFDLSGVCFSEEEEPFVREFAKEHRLNDDEFYAVYDELIQKAEVDEITGTEVWHQLLKRYSLSGEPECIIDNMLSKKKEYPNMLMLVRALRQHYKTAYFTNYNRYYWNILSKRFDLTPYFDYGVVSYEIKSRKPAPEGFHYLIKKCNIQPKEAVFTDDSAKRLANAAQMGIHTIHFQNKEQFVKELKKLGVETINKV